MARRRVDAGRAADEAARRVAMMEAAARCPVAEHAPVGGKGNGQAAPAHLLEQGPDVLRVANLGWLERDPPPVRWLLRDALPLGEVGMIAAPGGTAKTWLLLQLAIGVASGTSICDFGIAGPLWRPMQPGPVLMLTAEERADDVHRRLWAIVQALGLQGEPREWLRQNLHIASLRGDQNVLMARDGRSLTWEATKQAGRILRLAGNIPDLQLCILDPVSRFRAGEETDALAANALVAWIEELSQATGATCLVSAHAAKWARENAELHQDSIRGSSALVDGLRWGCIMRRMLEVEAHRANIPDEERHNKIQIAVPKSNNVRVVGTQWLEQMSCGALRLVRLMAGQRQDASEEQYEMVMGRVEAFLMQHPHEWTKTRLESELGGTAGVFRCGQKQLRAVLGRGIEEGRLLESGDGRGRGTLAVRRAD